jgi:hypothetical protein
VVPITEADASVANAIGSSKNPITNEDRIFSLLAGARAYWRAFCEMMVQMLTFAAGRTREVCHSKAQLDEVCRFVTTPCNR